MAEPTTTLAQLRRAIARELNMPFFKRYKNGYLDADSGTTSQLVDSALTQKDKFWSGAWVYRVASQEVSLITNFDAGTDTLSLEVPVTDFEVGDDYEIHSGWNAFDIHEAINQAIRDSRRIFRETITSETLIVEEDKLAYSLSDLSRAPFMIHKVWIEQPGSVHRGTVVSATSNTVTVPSGVLPSSLTETWMISIYAGTGKGQIRTLASVNVSGQAGVADWNTTPDSSSKFALWNTTEQINDWYPWHAIRYDSTKEFPDYLYFSRRPVDFQGLRIRLEYTAYPQELTAETDATPIPISYIVPVAISKLHGRKVGDNKVDRELHFAESRRYSDIAQAWLMQNAPHAPDHNVLDQHSGSYSPDSHNPLNWS
jgi:hypothetical protein